MEQIKPTLEQLKAKAYDCIATVEVTNRELQEINQMITNFKPEVVEEVKEIEEEPIKE